jgi:UDP-N-acetylmuramyl pentapeptide synthase
MGLESSTSGSRTYGAASSGALTVIDDTYNANPNSMKRRLMNWPYVQVGVWWF